MEMEKLSAFVGVVGLWVMVVGVDVWGMLFFGIGAGNGMVVDGGAGYESCVRGIGGVGGLVLFVVKRFYRRGIEWFSGIDG